MAQLVDFGAALYMRWVPITSLFPTQTSHVVLFNSNLQIPLCSPLFTSPAPKDFFLGAAGVIKMAEVVLVRRLDKFGGGGGRADGRTG